MWYLVLIVLLVFADQAVKAIIQAQFQIFESVPVIDGVFHLTYVKNTGAAFSIFEGKQGYFIAITAIVSCVLIIYLIKNLRRADRTLLVAISLITSGGIGNLIDRLKQGYVVDFFDFRIWPVFNIADIAVTCGCGLLILYLLVIEPKKAKK